MSRLHEHKIGLLKEEARIKALNKENEENEMKRKINMTDKDKKRAHIIFKRLKACGFNIELYRQRFGEPTVDDRDNYNKFYGGYMKI